MDNSKQETASKLRYFAGLAPLALLFIVGGFLHLASPAAYLKIMPPFLPWPRFLVDASGWAEIAGGLGLLLPRFRRAAAYGLAFLLVAVFPANVYMAVAHVPFVGIMGESWFQWLRLPLQIPLVLWAMHYGRKMRGKARSTPESEGIGKT